MSKTHRVDGRDSICYVDHLEYYGAGRSNRTPVGTAGMRPNVGVQMTDFQQHAITLVGLLVLYVALVLFRPRH